MLLKSYSFTGKHAKYMELLVGEDQENPEIVRPKFFERNIDVMFAAALIGFRQNTLGKADSLGTVAKRTINVEQILKNSKTIQFIYRLIVLLNQIDNAPAEDKLKTAFGPNTEIVDDGESRQTQTALDLEEERIFFDYILGGIEYLYDNLINNGNSDPIENIHQLIQDFDI